MRNTLAFCKVLAFIFLTTIYSCASIKKAKESNSIGNYQELEVQKSLILKGDRNALNDYKKLIKKADSLLIVDGFSVVHKTGLPPSGDKHDYMSIGPYWWPNPETDNGLPYIRKDGEINPEARNNFTDFVEIKNFLNTIKDLSDAYYLSNKTTYARKAIALINVWFLNSETKMNPNLNYGQSIPGKNNGRCFGIIEFDGIDKVVAFLKLAQDRGLIDQETQEGMFDWFTTYTNWLQTSKLGVEEGTRKNNHGTHYDVQLLNILFYLNRKEEIKTHLTHVTKARVFSQIEPDGSQPLELARTKSFSYSVMNLHGFLQLAYLGTKVGFNLWDLESEDGRGIKKGYQYMLPYLTKEKSWQHPQIKDIKHDEEKLISDLKYARKLFRDTSFDVVLQQLN
ncbi:MAG: alginate lyase family protein [Wenyingzhuangia sp.]